MKSLENIKLKIIKPTHSQSTLRLSDQITEIAAR